MNTLVCFSGQIGSGKSSVSESVALSLGWRRAGFGDYLRCEITRKGGDPNSRQALQELGQSLVETDPETFCRSVLEAGGFTPGDDFLLDGVRHVNVFRILQQLATPSVARLIFLSADEAFRLTRISDRTDRDYFNRAASHRVEAELSKDLPRLADVIVDATRPLDEVVDKCLSEISLWRRG